MESALRAYLIAYPTLTALIGGSSTPRLYWNEIPQTAADPCVVLYLIASQTGAHMQGSDNLTDNLVQINVRARDAVTMWQVRDAIKARLHAVRVTQGTTKLVMFHQSERQSFEKPGTVGYHTSQMDFLVWSGSTV